MPSYPRSMRLPLFPLGSTLFPGLVLPLHVFEQRYRDLMTDLLALPEGERRFGVVAIRQGHEVGVDGVRALHTTGCTAELVEHEELPDGRWSIVTTGGRRFSVGDLHEDRPYLTADVEYLPEETGDAAEAAVLVRAVDRAFRTYLQTLARSTDAEITVPDELPDSPDVLSYVVAATAVLDLETRQQLLTLPSAQERLREELRLLRRETTLMATLHTAPAPDFGRGGINPN